LKEKKHGLFSVLIRVLAFEDTLYLGDALRQDEKLSICLSDFLNIEVLHIVPGIEGVHLFLPA
jgi:hypothetical protein